MFTLFSEFDFWSKGRELLIFRRISALINATKDLVLMRIAEIVCMFTMPQW